MAPCDPLICTHAIQVLYLYFLEVIMKRNTWQSLVYQAELGYVSIRLCAFRSFSPYNISSSPRHSYPS